MSIITQQLLATTWLEWFGTATGLAAVGLSIGQRRAAWPLFIACYGAYVWLSASAGLYAAAGMNGVFVVLSVIGWRAWGDSGNEEEGIQAASPKTWGLALAIWIASTALITGVLVVAGGSEIPWLDAGATTSGFVAQWLLTRKVIATWAFWLVSDVAFMVLYGQAGYWVTVGLFGVFLVLALQGMLQWNRELREAAA